MKIKFVGENSISLTNGKIYKVLSIEQGWYRIIDDTEEDYLFSPDSFEVIEKQTVRRMAMARDDYHAIVYQILSYLYTNLKKGIAPEPERLSNTALFNINRKYWEYILYNLDKGGYVEGLTITTKTYINGERVTVIDGIENCQITPKGIEYLSDNSFMTKAMDFFKDVKSIAPFI